MVVEGTDVEDGQEKDSGDREDDGVEPAKFKHDWGIFECDVKSNGLEGSTELPSEFTWLTLLRVGRMDEVKCLPARDLKALVVFVVEVCVVWVARWEARSKVKGAAEVTNAGGRSDPSAERRCC